MTEFARGYVAETIEILGALDLDAVDRVATGFAAVRERGGRLFVLGVGGSAGHASHAVNDFRKICGIEAYAPTDNVSELTARINDEGWETSLAGWLEVSRLGADDALLVFSVGGGDLERNISPNLVRAWSWRVEIGAQVYGIVGRDGGYTGARRKRRRDHPTAARRADHAPHRGTVRGRVAPARVPSVAPALGDEVGARDR